MWKAIVNLISHRMDVIVAIARRLGLGVVGNVLVANAVCATSCQSIRVRAHGSTGVIEPVALVPAEKGTVRR